jgi:hypothetical protein
MKAMIRSVDDHGKRYDCIAFVCPGCVAMLGGSGIHMLAVNTTVKSPSWDWNGDLQKPTLSPSILTGKGTQNVCHSFLRNGVFQFLTDSNHRYCGKEVAMPDLPDWFVKEK